MANKTKYYVVWKGRKTGIFTTWETCVAQVHGYTGARYKSYPSRTAAEQAFQGKSAPAPSRPEQARAWLLAPHPPLSASYCVDAACSGNPGLLEYRGVDLSTGRQIFREGPYQNGTNNIGEFLAIVHALVLLEKKHSAMPVYSDSSIAIGWVRKKRCNTELAADSKNASLFKRIDQAEDWLTAHTVANRILKWDTQAWGEIPADFGRK